MKNTIITAIIYLFTFTNVSAQILTDVPCYAVNDNNGNGPSNLFMYNPATVEWSNLGEIDPIGDGVEAIAIDPVDAIIYMYDAGNRQFGIVDPNSANPTLFIPNGGCNGPGVGTADGDYGEIDLDDVDGLTYDSVNKILYGTHHINSGDLCDPIQGTNDVLFQIDPSTGCYIPGVMLDGNGYPADYAIIEETIDDHTIQTICEVGGDYGAYDVDDIAYNTYTGELFAIQNQAGGPGVISAINPVNGFIEAVLFDVDEDNIEGLAFTMLGELYAISGDSGPTGPQNAFIYIDLQNQTTDILPFPDPTGVFVDFEALDCLQLSNDLALKMVIDASVTSPIQPGDDVTFNIIVYNQGNFSNSDILIANYIAEGLVLNDPNWAPIPGVSITKIVIPGPIAPGDSSQVSINFTVDPAFTGGTIDSYAEISASFNQDVQDNYGDLIPMPDNDSTPDQVVNNDPVIDNRLGPSSPFNYDDEDDHDIETIIISSGMDDCPPNWTITNDTPYRNIYQSNGQIITQGFVLISNGQQVKYVANKIELNKGFGVEVNAEFEIDTDGCN